MALSWVQVANSHWLYLLIIIVLEFLQIHQSNRDLPRKSVDFSEKLCEKRFFLLASSKDSTCRKTLDPSEETQPKWQCLENPLEVPALPTIFYRLLPRAFLRQLHFVALALSSCWHSFTQRAILQSSSALASGWRPLTPEHARRYARLNNICSNIWALCHRTSWLQFALNRRWLSRGWESALLLAGFLSSDY